MKQLWFILTVVVAALTAQADVVTEFYARPDSMRRVIEATVAATPAEQLPALLERADSLHFAADAPQPCEALMAEWLKAALPRLADTDAEVARWKLESVCELNAEGTEAADFRFELPDGKKVRLSRYLRGKPLLVLFYDPLCRHCEATIGQLRQLNLPARLNVLAVCIDSTPQLWEETRTALPQGWQAAFDLSGVNENEIYMIRSLPSLYLLDGEHRVILKNPPVERLQNYLNQ